MEIEVQTEDEQGNVTFHGILKQHEVNFCLNVGINFLLAQGAMPFVRDTDEAEGTMVGPGSDEMQ